MVLRAESNSLYRDPEFSEYGSEFVNFTHASNCAYHAKLSTLNASIDSLINHNVAFEVITASTEGYQSNHTTLSPRCSFHSTIAPITAPTAATTFPVCIAAAPELLLDAAAAALELAAAALVAGCWLGAILELE